MKSLLTKIAGSIAVAGVVVGGVMLKTNDCPIKGDSPQVRLQHLDSLKNRYPSTITPTPISFDALAKETDQTKVVSVEGYVLLAKSGNGESCNCHTTNKDDMDIHIEIVKSLPATNKDAIICEITRFSKGSYTLKGIEALKGKKVRITGFIFLDQEHKQNSVIDDPDGNDDWRLSITEIHPVIKIEEVK